MSGSAVGVKRRQIEMPTYRAYPARVVQAVRLSPHFVRVTFGGPDLDSFGYAGYDQRVKVLLARPGRTLADLPTGEDWYLRWRALPDDVRPTMRTYTVRAYRPSVRELDVDFVLHGAGDDPSGPLSEWAAAARPGDEVALLGPDRPGSGRLWGAEWAPPPTATRVLVAGDETAVPAMGAIVESLPEHLRGVVAAEVPTLADVPQWQVPAGIDVRWLVRERPRADAPRGTLLEETVREALPALCHRAGADPGAPTWEGESDDTVLWDVPEHVGSSGETYVWMAGEAGAMKRLRRLARRDLALPRSAVASMGYWRQGHAEAV